jgi:hypothetical protein
MKKIFFFITVIILISFTGVINLKSANAQDTWLGVIGGLSIPSLQGGNTEQSKGYKSRFGPDFGILLDHSLSERFAIQIELSYVSQGGIKKGIQALDPTMLTGLPVPEGTPLYANFKNEAIMNYIELPVLAKYFMPLKKTYNFYIDGGPNFGYLVSGKTKTSGTSQIYLDAKGQNPITEIPAQSFKAETDIKNDLKKMNVGITGGVGISKPLGPGDLILDVRGSYGFIDVQKDPVNGKNNTGCLVISVGYAIKI